MSKNMLNQTAKEYVTYNSLEPNVEDEFEVISEKSQSESSNLS